MDEFAGLFPSRFLLASDEWISAVHINQLNAHNTLRALSEMRTSRHMEVIPGQRHLIVELMKKVFVDDPKIEFNEDFLMRRRFPGPMALTVSRRHLHLLRDHQYWITEKSDGIRCMILSISSPYFPRWLLSFTHAKGHKAYRSFRLYDTCVVEAALSEHDNSSNFECMIDLECGRVLLKVRDGKVTLITLEENPEFIDHEAKSLPQRERMGVPSVKEILFSSGTSDLRVELRRETGRHFTYVFDRKVLMYLCEDEFMFPVEKDFEMHHKNIILDGEFVWNLVDKRYNYSVYDIVCCSVGRRVLREVNFVLADLCAKRMAIEHIAEVHHAYYAMRMCEPKPVAMQIIRKKFYGKNDIRELLSFIKRTSSGRYIYKNYNYTDGLVFTPESHELYTFSPGLCSNLMKWKWPDKLTVDFTVNRDGMLFYLVGGEIGAYKRDPELAKDIPDGEETAVKECLFDVEVGRWVALMTRTDKNHPNALAVVANTLESYVENVRVQDMISAMSGIQSSPQRPPDDALYDQNLLAHLQIQGWKNGKRVVVLSYWYKTTNGNRGWMEYAHVPSSHWQFLQRETGISGEGEFIREVMNQKGRIVRCAFLPNEGEWAIVSLRGDEKMASDRDLLVCLERLCVFYRKVQASR